MSVGNGPGLEQLIESGQVTDAMSAEQIAEIVRNHESSNGEKDHRLVFSETPADPSAQVSTEVTPPVEQAAPQVPPAAAPAPPAAADQEVPAPVATPNGVTTIPYGVLKQTRERNAKLTTDLEALHEKYRTDTQQLKDQLAAQAAPANTSQQAQVQAAANRAGIRDADGNPIDVASIDITSLRDAYPAELVNLIGALQATVIDLTQRDRSRQTQDNLTAAEQQQRDIDTVPAWAGWQVATSDVMWKAANAALTALNQDASWAGKSRVERMEEVARQFGAATPAAQPAPTTPTVTPGTKAAEAMRQAQARSIPISHSDLPAGSPPAQSELEQLASLDATDLAVRMQGMTRDQQDEFIRRYG